MPTQSISWEYGASSGNTQPKGFIYCSTGTAGNYGYVGVSSTCYDTYAYTYFQAYVYASCLSSVTVPDFTFDGRVGTFCNETLVNMGDYLYNCGSQVSQSPEFAACVRVIGASSGTVYYESYKFLDNIFMTNHHTTLLVAIGQEEILALQAPNKRRTHFPGKIRIFSVGFTGSAPARIPTEIEIR